ncbi:hypothetical protein ABPG74_022908 [Tetrahymena malaccensis]
MSHFRTKSFKVAAHKTPSKYEIDDDPNKGQDLNKISKFSKENFMSPSPKKQKFSKSPERSKPFKKYDLTKISPAPQKYVGPKKYKEYWMPQILEESGIDFDSCIAEHSYLPLKTFNNTDYDFYSNEEIQQKLQDRGEMRAQAIIQREEKRFEWEEVLVISYDQEKELFTVQTQDQLNFFLNRIELIFVDEEDPFQYTQKLINAWNMRTFMDSILRYNFYLDNMPCHDMEYIDEQTERNILSLVFNKSILQEGDVTQLLEEVNQQYVRTQNKLVFNKYLSTNASDIFPTPLILPPAEEKLVPEKGKLMLERLKGAKELVVYESGVTQRFKAKIFEEIRKDFANHSIYSIKEVIQCLSKLENECQQIEGEEIFVYFFDKPQEVNEFRISQDSHIDRKQDLICNKWPERIEKIFERTLQISKNKSRIIDDDKLERVMALVRYKMQDTIYNICNYSFNKLYEFLFSFVPDQVKIINSGDVQNIYDSKSNTLQTSPRVITIESQNGMNSMTSLVDYQEKPKKEFALYKIAVVSKDDTFQYSYDSNFFLEMLQAYFKNTLNKFQKIADIEFKLNSNFQFVHKSKQYVKAPQLPNSEPRRANLNETGDNRVDDENLWVWDLWVDLTQLIKKCVDPLDEYLTHFKKFENILRLNPDTYSKEFEGTEENPRDIQEIREEIIQTLIKEEETKKLLPELIKVSIFEIDLKIISNTLAGKYKKLSNNLKDIICLRAKKLTNNIITEFQEMHFTINKQPSNIEELTDIQNFISNVPTEMEKKKVEIDRILEIYDILDEFMYRLEKEAIKSKQEMQFLPKKTLQMLEKRISLLDDIKSNFLRDQQKDQDMFRKAIDAAQKKIMTFHSYTNINQHEEVAQKATELFNELAKMIEQSRKFNTREQLFGQQMTDYSKIVQMQKDFTPYYNLWTISSKWFENIQIWLYSSWDKLDAPYCEKFVEDGFRTLGQTIRFFKEKNLSAVQKIAEKVKKEFDEFRPKVPLMVALKKQGMKDRHWDAITNKVGFEVRPDNSFNFQKVLDMGLMTHIEHCVEIGEQAAKEYTIEEMLKNMKSKWATVEFDLMSYKHLFIIRGSDEIQALLDEHLVNTQAMQFSPYKKPFEEEIIEWNNQLKLMSDILEEWIKVQLQWMYLQPIFDSKDIAKQLPHETRKFKQVDDIWKKAMIQARDKKLVIRVCSEPNLLENLRNANEKFDQIQKELNNYLEKKREKFARFYFLSNDDLLEILSQTKEPTAVQPHLKKVFENIHQIEFDDQKIIHAMFSAEKEKINFVKTVNPNHKNVEEWMGEVENMMKASVRFELFNSYQKYPDTPRTRWVVSHPGQCVLNGSQMQWTLEVEQALKQNSVKKYWDILSSQLNDLVDLVRTKLTKQQMVTINALIVIDVHAKDVTEILWRNEITDISAFEWISQLRYYWEKENCMVKCIQTSFPYGYEYLGNTLRLVITPLTDKCYMTLMGALKLNLGGAPAGPAGTGKTESTKDLAKALAKQCVVFNCSDSMDYIMLGKFFKGLASAGAWCCFDEFNRINIEVLSVIAQQLLILFGEKAKGSSQCEFEGSIIKIQPTFCVFITMNPGYAGRTELPDNLKALFRAVAMMVPDYAMIGEIMLYSFGFKQGRDLAKKMVATFKLSSEQLSSQDHYDYGMRAVRSVINAAGLLKAAEPDMNEEQLLLRALRDVNVPKFLKDDLPLFENIILDLFPGVDKPVINYGELLDAMSKQSKVLGLQPVKPFLDKVIQLYDTIQVRHGLMLVGPTGGGKTSNYRVLQKAMTSLEKKGQAKVNTHIMNPKSITMGQLYGQFNDATHEWSDGVLAYIIRETVKDQSSDRHWIVFDGPVDAIWIESMNTVLDDNKKLCLNSGQILTLTPYMTMMFEVEDLAVASPATVSRCGMVYMEPSTMGLTPLINSWMDFRITESFRANKLFVPKLQSLFEEYLEFCIDFIRKNCIEIVDSMNNNLAQSLMRNLNCFLVNYVDTDFKKIPAEEIEKLLEHLEQIFIFSLIWSIGCTITYEGRVKFDKYLRGLMKQNQCSFNFPEEGLVYDYQYIEKAGEFQHWKENFKDFAISDKLGYHEIMIPTADSTRNMYFTKIHLTIGQHVMSPGPTGTGKSLNLFQLLGSQMDEQFQYIALAFSAQTSANQTQDTIDSKMDKRRKGYYGPPIGKKCIIFIDDLNMPKKETYGAQPPIELIRQFIDHRGWYNRKDLQFMKLEDIILLTAMGPPGGGRTFITNRFVRHFNILAYTELDEGTIKQIFGTMSSYFLNKFEEPIKKCIQLVVDTSYNVYQRVREELLPTPSKSHYTFNLRDINKVFQGVCNASSKHVTECAQLVRLWFHENMRVYHDRLTTEEDRQYLKNLLIGYFEQFGLNQKDVLDMDRIIFGDFIQGRDSDSRPYQQVPDLNELLTKMNDFQDEYNNEVGVHSKKAMKLVMFLDACEHISRIARIIRQPLGNALLLGVGGSGRQSLSKMATFICNYKLFQIEVIKNYSMKNWREDIKEVLKIAGIENVPVTFLFVDTQIINEQMCEDLNSILNSGDVTNIYNDKDMEEIMDACKGECIKKNLQPNKMNVFTQYLARVKNNIHLVIAMSPLGEAFTTRLRRFPSFVSCSTIDWFTEWPEEALIGVGLGALREVDQELGIEEQVDSLVDMFKIIHKSVEKISIKYLNELRRHNYVTPTSYLELLQMYKQILKEKKTKQKNAILRLQNGLDKLHAANQATVELQVKLGDMKPLLEKASIETEQVMAKLSVDQKEAEEAEKLVAAEEKIAKAQQQDATDLADKASAAVADANKILDATLQEVQKLKKDHLVEVKALPNPPKAVKVVLGGIVILNLDYIKKCGGNIITKKVEGTLNQKEEDYFETAKKFLLNDPAGLLDMLKGFDKNNINPYNIQKLEKTIMPDPDFTLSRAQTCSYAVQFLFQWVKAMYDYNKVYLETKPLRDKLDETQKILDEKTKELNEKKAKLDKIQQQIKGLEDLYNSKVQLKEQLTNQMNDCQIKLERAIKLTSGLSGEQKRWNQEILNLKDGELYLAGNSVIGAAMVAYSGPFTSHYRTELEQQWVRQLTLHSIMHTEKITMRQFLGEPVKIQQWNIAGLPKDDSSTENGIIIDQSRRWTLMIDPQTQANKFIKNLGKDHAEGLDVLKISNPQLMRTLELAIQFGKRVLLENVGRDLDPSLEPILQQQVVKVGSQLSITIGEKNLTYNPNFKLYMTTTIPNPHYPPETFVKVTIINFGITPSGLEEQMLAQIVALENPQLEQKKLDIVIKNANDKRQLLNIEDSILQELSSIKGGIEEVLKDENLIEKLQNSKKFAEEINKRVEESKITEAQIDEAREGYRPVAFSSSWLFFCILDLCLIDPMYQYSLQWFMNLFVMAVENSEVSNILEERLDNLDKFFTYSLYENICRSLFEKHKLLFSLMLTVKILQGKDLMNKEEWRYLLAGPSGDIKVPDNPTQWISENSWPDIYRQIYGMNHIEAFKGIEEHFMKRPDDFKILFDSLTPQTEPLPGEWEKKLNQFEKIIVLKSFRPDKVVPAIQNWIEKIMGKKFIMAPGFDLPKCFKDSTQATPLIFVLSTGSDPVADFMRFAEEQSMLQMFESISLGQGQGVKAERMIREAVQKGTWVLLQNCHLASSWMSELERLCEELDGDNVQKTFRLWLTSMPSKDFPISVLQNGVKMTLEPPQGLRNNLLRTYNNLDSKDFEECQKPLEFRRLLFGFCLFHAIIQDRRKFGPIGWNIAYEFTNEDLTVCRRQLRMLLDEYEQVPYKVLNFLGAEINYGGRVTDDKDVRLIKTILQNYVCSQALDEGYKYSKSGIYYQPKAETIDDFIRYITDLPLNPEPEAFGLHDNAEITNSQNTTRELLETILSVQPRSSSSGAKSREQQIEEIADYVQSRTPEVFDFQEIYKKYPTKYEESMNTVLVQEIIRYNRLLAIMKESLVNVKKALKGLVVMSEELELLANSLFDNQVPVMWEEKGFLSLKPLSSWTQDLNDRVNFLNEWIENGTPKVFWISGFFFPQAFITGTLQNFARQEIIAVDKLSFEFKILDNLHYTDIQQKPKSGCYIYGIYLEGAKWNYKTHMIDDPQPKELYSDLPLIHLVPKENRQVPESGIYNSPLYKVVSRRGTLSTTGHSTNFVMFLELPTDKKQEVWITAGVAAFLSLRY